MAVAYDTASAAQTFSNVTTPSTWTHTASGANRYVRLSIAWAKLGSSSVSATYGGNAMTSAGQATNSGGLGAGVTGKAAILEYIAPSTSSQTVAPTFDAGGNFGVAITVSYTGVHQTSPSGTAQTATGTAASSSINVSSATGDMVSDCVVMDENAITYPTNTGTRRMGTSESGGGYGGAVQDAAGAATVAMGWTFSATKGFAHVAINIAQASAATPKASSVYFAHLRD